MSIIDRLIEIYEHEDWHMRRLNYDELRIYYRNMLAQGRIILVMEEDTILGVCEFARLNLSQLGYVMLSDSITPDIHDERGSIVYVISLYIDPECRGVGMVNYFRKELERLNPEAAFFTGETQGKHKKVWHIYKRSHKGAAKHGQG